MLVRLFNRRGIAVSNAVSGKFLLDHDAAVNVTALSFTIPTGSKVYFLELVSETVLDKHMLFDSEIVLLCNTFLREEYMLPDLSNVYSTLGADNIFFPIRSIKFQL